MLLSKKFNPRIFWDLEKQWVYWESISHTLIGISIEIENVVLEHLPFNMGGHCDMTPFTCTEFNLQFIDDSTYVNGAMSQWPPMSNGKCVLGPTNLLQWISPLSGVVLFPETCTTFPNPKISECKYSTHIWVIPNSWIHAHLPYISRNVMCALRCFEAFGHNCENHFQWCNNNNNSWHCKVTWWHCYLTKTVTKHFHNIIKQYVFVHAYSYWIFTSCDISWLYSWGPHERK